MHSFLLIYNLFIFFFFELCLSSGKFGTGITFFCYNVNPHTLSYLVKYTENSAFTYKLHNNISITLFTNYYNYSNNNHIFDNVFYINKNHLYTINTKFSSRGRQWATRLYYLSKTPYLYTLSIDSDTFCCSTINFSGIFKYLNENNIDMSFGNHFGIGSYFVPGAGIIFYKWSDNLKNLLQEWFFMLYSYNIADDDQKPLNILLSSDNMTKKKYKIIVTNPSYGVRFRPVKEYKFGEFKYPHHSLVIYGRVHLIHEPFFYRNIEKSYKNNFNGSHEIENFLYFKHVNMTCNFFNKNYNISRAFGRAELNYFYTEKNKLIKESNPANNHLIIENVGITEFINDEQCSKLWKTNEKPIHCREDLDWKYNSTVYNNGLTEVIFISDINGYKSIISKPYEKKK